MEVHTVRGAGDVALHVEEWGSGRPVLFVHGYSQSRLSWWKQLDSDLADDFRLVAFDLRGHGESEKPRNVYDDSELWAEDVHAVVTEFGLDDVILVAWSYGGLVALDYLAEHGTDWVARVALVGAISGIGTEAATDRLGPEYVDLVDALASTNAAESVDALDRFVDLCVAGDLAPADHYFMLGYNVAVPPHVRDSLRDRTVDHDPTLAALDVPVLLVHGEEDAVVRPAAARHYADLVDDVRLSMYPEAGHSPFWELPNRFNRELRRFIDGA